MKGSVKTIKEIDNPKTLGKIQNDKKLAITPIIFGASLIA